jgi:hypothetical protein
MRTSHVLSLLRTGSYSKQSIALLVGQQMGRKWSISVIESDLKYLKKIYHLEQDGNLYTITNQD